MQLHIKYEWRRMNICAENLMRRHEQKIQLTVEEVAKEKRH